MSQQVFSTGHEFDIVRIAGKFGMAIDAVDVMTLISLNAASV